MRVHLIDGTYELFRHFYALPSEKSPDGQEIAAVKGVVGSMLGLLEAGATHLAVATDHVIESFRNDLWPGYKDGSAIDPDLLSQFHPLEGALTSLGVTVWPMEEFEADDALAAGAALAEKDSRVQQVLICTPDKDLAQCVVGERVVQFDRRQRLLTDQAGVRSRYGVDPESIPDYLALVGDSSDGFPGLRGWGKKSAATVLGVYSHLEGIPPDPNDWQLEVRSAERLADTLVREMEQAKLFRQIATVRRDAPVSSSVDELEWRGPTPSFEETARNLNDPDLWDRARALTPA